MKKLVYLTLLVTLSVTAQVKYVLPNEAVVFSFTAANGKKAVVVRDKKFGYIAYRYGTDKKIELDYPREKNKSSWDKFSYAYYHRGGGKRNSGMDIENLMFENGGYKYVIYNNYSAGDDISPAESRAGIILEKIDSGKQVKDIKAKMKTVKGGWQELRNNGYLKENKDGLY